MINNALIPEFTKLYDLFRQTEDYENRIERAKFGPVAREIILETLKNVPLKMEHLTGFIQMFKADCKDETFDRYLEQNIKDASIRKSISHKAYEIGWNGFTGAGLNAVRDLEQTQLDAIKSFLQKAYSITSASDAVLLCKEFDSQNIPFVTSGIYSPWLYYINPSVFPISNNSHKEFRKWIGMGADYPSTILDFHQLRDIVREIDLGTLDLFAHNFEYYKKMSQMQTLDLKGKRFYKMSHGVFSKIKTYRESGILKLLETNNWIVLHQDTKKKQAEKFKNEADIGDFVYVCYASKMWSVGKIISDSQPLPPEADSLINGNGEWRYRKIEVLFYANDNSTDTLEGNRKSFLPSGYTTFKEVPKNFLGYLNEKLFIPNWNLQIVDSTINKDNPSDTMSDSLVFFNENADVPLNLILFGPPGTGKTYKSMEYALCLSENQSLEEIEAQREEEKEQVQLLFETRIKEGRIAFCTFHQSMGYEDFIEGIKPLKPEEYKPLQYDVTDGIFKKMCVEATFSLLSHISEALPKKIADFEQQYAHFIDIVNERLAKGELIKLKTKSGGIILVDSVSTNNNLIVKHENGGRTYPASFNRLSKLSNAFPDLNNISNIDEEFRKVIGGSNATTNWAVLNGIREMSALVPGKPVDVSTITYESKIEAIRDFKLTNDGAKKIKDAPKHVLIIDEINRGNVAQIFGELITLIESDKRLGGENYIPMTLAYSKNETFSVPPNLYIIGTMNTADRSVEALDTALRRRFDFIHLQPQADTLSSKIEGLDLDSMLTSINKRLEVLLDRDHTIGHAWFWNVSNLDGLKTVFKNKILPLLQEYFYNDYEKIGLVLGDAFVRSEKTEKGIFAKFTGGNGLADEYSSNSLYYINDIDQLTEEDFASIYHIK